MPRAPVPMASRVVLIIPQVVAVTGLMGGVVPTVLAGKILVAAERAGLAVRVGG